MCPVFASYPGATVRLLGFHNYVIHPMCKENTMNLTFSGRKGRSLPLLLLFQFPH